MNDGAQIAETSRLLIEPLVPKHAACLYGALVDPRVWEHTDGQPPLSIEELAAQFARMAAGPGPGSSDRWLNFAVCLKRDSRWIGRIQATIHDRWAEIGYLFNPADWGQGYATESLEWLHRVLRFDQQVEEIWASVDPANERSIRLLRRAGYREVPIPLMRSVESYQPGDAVFKYAFQV